MDKIVIRNDYPRLKALVSLDNGSVDYVYLKGNSKRRTYHKGKTLYAIMFKDETMALFAGTRDDKAACMELKPRDEIYSDIFLDGFGFVGKIKLRTLKINYEHWHKIVMSRRNRGAAK